MLTPPTRKCYFFFKFSHVSSIWHTFFVDFRCPKTMQSAKYICNFSKQVAFSFERGYIDVRTSRAKASLFFALFHVYHVLDTLFFTKEHEKSLAPKLRPRSKNIAKRKYILNFWKKVFISFERGDIDVRPSRTKSILFFHFFECIMHLINFFGMRHVWEQWKA